MDTGAGGEGAREGEEEREGGYNDIY